MTTEKEKAKRYDEALEWMRKVYPTLTGAAKEDAEHYFPELKESEDETHRKWILEYLYDGLRKSDEQFKGQFKSAIAWLEKQKEQKPVTINQDEKEFLADEITAFLCNYDKEFDGEDPVPSEIAEHFYLLGKQAQEQKQADEQFPPLEGLDAIKAKYYDNGFKNGFDEGVESVKPAEWSEEDENKLNHILEIVHIAPGREVSVDEKEELESFLKSLCPQPKAKLTRLDENIIKAAVAFVEQNDHFNCWGGIDKHTVIKALRSLKSHQKSAEWSEEDEEMRKTIIQVLKSFVSQADCESNPSLSASYPTYYKEIDWFETLPERFNLQPKQEWSKEDAEMLNSCISSIEEAKENRYAYKETDGDTSYDHEIAWLKSLHPQAKQEQKPEAKLTGWVARDKEHDSYYGTGLILYSEKPRRSGDCWSGTIAAQLPWEIFPELKWEDEPIEVEIIIRKK